MVAEEGRKGGSSISSHQGDRNKRGEKGKIGKRKDKIPVEKAAEP